MSVQKTERLQIRVTPKLKSAIELFCKNSDIDITYFLTTLLRSHLRKAGYLMDEEKIKHHMWSGDIDDMPTPINEDKRWKFVG